MQNEKKRYRLYTRTKGVPREWITADTRDEAIAKRAVREKELEEGKKRISKQMLCREWYKEYMRVYREKYICYTSYKGEETLWRSHIAPALGNLSLVQVLPMHCKEVLSVMAGKGRREKQVRKARIFMKAFFRAAVENGLLIENPCENIKLPVCAEDGSHRNITDTERAVLLEACRLLPYPHGLWMKVQLYCGARPDEPTRIRRSHIDACGARLFLDGTKNKAARRWVPIPREFLKEITGYASDSDELVFSNGYGRPINDTNRKRMWRQLKKEMHILMGGETDFGEYRRPVEPCLVANDFVPYCLRHTFCTDLAKAGVPLITAAKYMGHTTITMVAKIYTHVDEEMDADAIRKINAYQKKKRVKVDAAFATGVAKRHLIAVK